VCSLAKQFGAALLLLAASGLHALKEPSPTDLDFTATPARDIVKRLEDVPVVIRLTNKSATAASNVRITLVSRDFALPNPLTIPLLAPFGSETRQITIAVRDSANFTSHHPVLVGEYEWGSNPVHHSARSAPLNLQVVHQYEDEAKGLPGGSAALLYLILPIVPAFLAYDLVDGIRLGQGLKLPKFDTAYLAPAFLMAILVEYLLVLSARSGSAFDLTEPGPLLCALAVSTLAGVSVPGVRIIHQSIRMRKAFNRSDDLSTYLQKALEQCPDGLAQWVEGSGEWKNFAGLLLTQPDKKTVLGARLQVSPSQQDADVLRRLTGCFDANGNLSGAAQLLQLVNTGKATLGFLDRVEEAGTPSANAVVTHGLEGLTHQAPQAKQIVERFA
jgi:hypothetical protein